MLDKIKELFRPQSPEVIAQKELEAARRDLLVALSAVDYARSVVKYNTDRIERLELYLKIQNTN